MTSQTKNDCDKGSVSLDNLVSVSDSSAHQHSGDKMILTGYETSKLYLETSAMCDYAMSVGLEVPAKLIQESEVIRFNIKQGISVDDLGVLAKMHQQLAKIVAPASPQNLLLIENEKSRESIFSFVSLFPLARSIIAISLVFLISFILLGQLEIVNEENLKAGILGSHGFTAIAILGYLVSCAGLGACFTSLYRIREYVSNLTFDPRHNSSYWASILLGTIAGLFISELLFGFISSTSADSTAGYNAQLGKPAMALLAGFSSNMVYTLLQRIVDSIESLFKGDQKQIRQVRRNADLGELKNRENEVYMDVSHKLMNIYQKGENNPELMRAELKSALDEIHSKR
ncbi:hypothetical protein NBRC116188_09190 [Oceaniserpentilla sp. 4NH20-0058]|uniref:hypothetical protein n=1 Tax=Oceaniserpentilla sp. 4NH20-0058 TaxID=3127660 RepID=UPI003109CD17